MDHFLGTHQNRLDAKGRVSVPAPFRAVLRAKTTASASEGGVPIILWPSHQLPCVEAWPEAAFAALSEPLERLNRFGEEHDDLAMALYGDAYPILTDKEGRMVLSDKLLAHAGVTDAVTFIGLGKTFQIWEPAAAERQRAEARERARARGYTLPGLAR